MEQAFFSTLQEAADKAFDALGELSSQTALIRRDCCFYTPSISQIDGIKARLRHALNVLNTLPAMQKETENATA